ncbi:MAG: TonB-dependent receptor [Bacteroidales bacterium]|nr:TonB-dependent receptor [Bacteroidales bacterium]
MKHVKYIALVLAVALCGNAAAQGKLTGRVVEKSGGAAIEYATIAVLKTTDSSLVAGNVSLEGGKFEVEKIPYGTYLVRITLMGFKPYYHPESVTFSAGRPTVNIGKITLSPTATVLKAAEVTAERSMMEYQLDKRVINVDKNIVTGGGTASDVLDNVPSVSVDNDGEVTLRGSSNVKVLINGRPYELMGSELDVLLEQIPASSIENVEVITNPSAKYDPEGMSGIINIKLKEQTSGALGLTGTVNANFGAPLPFQIPDLDGYNDGAMDPRLNYTKFIPTAMGTINLNYATHRWNFFLNVDGGMRGRGNRSKTDIWRYNSGSTISHDSLFEYNRHQNTMTSVKVGAEYYFKNNASLMLSYTFNGGKRTRFSYIHADDILNRGQYDYRQTDTNFTKRLNQTAYLLFIKKWDKKDQQLTLDLTYTHRHGTGGGGQCMRYDVDSIDQNLYYWRVTDNLRGGNSLNAKLDYTHPFAERFKLEVGYEGLMNQGLLQSDYYMNTHDTTNALDAQSSVNEDYRQQIHAIYATFGGTIVQNLSAQVGLRGEYSKVKGIDYYHNNREMADTFYMQVYPTVHLSYNITDNQSIQLSYSKRVRRPRMQSLDAYINIRQGKEMSFGNPRLNPEYTHALELSYNVGFKQTNIFTSLYFRQTDHKMTMYGFVWDSASVDKYCKEWMIYNSDYDGYWASTWQNMGKGINYGMEIIWDQQILKWWKMNLSVNLYGEYIEGTALLDNKSDNSFRVSGKLSSYMNLPKDWAIQFSGQFRPGFHDLQTTMIGSVWFDLAIKKDVLKRQGTINLRVSDVFCTGRYGHTTVNDQMNRVFRGNRIAPTITLGFSYKINNGLKQEKKQTTQDTDAYDME